MLLFGVGLYRSVGVEDEVVDKYGKGRNDFADKEFAASGAQGGAKHVGRVENRIGHCAANGFS